jgi:enediyne biosynthesis protein CalE3
VLSASEAARVLRYQSFLLDDAARLDAWQAAIGVAVRPGDVVLDLGAGMGILSLFACEAGASRVYAVESAASAELARLVAAGNGLEERIVCLHERSQDVELPERADVLLTDTTETFGLNGRLLSAVLDARARLLKPDARLLPAAIELRVAPVEAPRAYRYLVDVWARDVRGFDLSAIRPFAANNMQPSALDADDLLAEPSALGGLDLASLSEPTFAGRTRLTATRGGTAHGLGGFFAARLADGIELTNDPREATVSYAQALLPLAEPLALAAGDELAVEVSTHDGREWSWQVERTPARGGAAERRQQATLHGFPRTPDDLLAGRERPADP